MASKRTTMIYPNRNITTTETKFSGDREAYGDMRGQDELARMDSGVSSKETIGEMVAVIWNTGVVMTIHYSFDTEEFWEA